MGARRRARQTGYAPNTPETIARHNRQDPAAQWSVLHAAREKERDLSIQAEMRRLKKVDRD